MVFLLRHCGSGRGHDGTIDTAPAQSEPPEDCNIHRAKSPTPVSETFTRAESTPSPLTLLTQPPPLLRLRRAFLIILQTPTHSGKLQQGDLGIPTPQMQRIRPTHTALNHTTNLNSQYTLPSDVTEAIEGITQHELECSCHFLIISFTPPQNFRLHLHASTTSRILLPFHVCYTLP